MLNPELHSSSAAREQFPLPATRGDGFSTSGTWFGPVERPLAGWWTSPDAPSCRGVVIAQPLGYEYWSCHRSLRTLAEALARAGWHVLRFDWDGTGDSAGAADDPDRVAAWRASLGHAVSEMRNAGIQHLALVGVRLGATLALLDSAALGVDEVVACAPIGSGRRFTRELKMLGITDPVHPDVLMYSGLAIDPDTTADLAAIDLEKRPAPGVARIFVVTRDPSHVDKLVVGLRQNGKVVDTHACPQMQSMLDVPAGEDSLPENFVAPIIGWLGETRTATETSAPVICASTVLSWKGGCLRETFTQVDGLTAVQCEPLDHISGTVVVFLNSGADPHVGPGRAWVEYARALALHNHVGLRVNFGAWGESPDEGHAPGRPYDLHCINDTLRIVAALRSRYRRVVLVGLCAGAWVAMKAAQQTFVDGVFAINPQLYWQPGYPLIILIPDSKRWWAPFHKRNARLARFGLWSFLDAVGIRPMASRWLIALRKRKVRVMFSFAEDDEGLDFLRVRCGRRLARELRSSWLSVEEVPGIDHPMFRMWRRPAIIAQMLRFLDSLPRAGTAGGP